MDKEIKPREAFLYLDGYEKSITAKCGCELTDEDLQFTYFFMCDAHKRGFELTKEKES
jgi:hypothetical protein